MEKSNIVVKEKESKVKNFVGAGTMKAIVFKGTFGNFGSCKCVAGEINAV